jgi:hypothetical protein
MDKKIIIWKIKKYLFFISIVFLVATSTHLWYKYIYHDSKEVAEKWGTISEAIIWPFPHLNPLKKSNDYNDYINNILYRSLLTYSTKTKNIEWDITNCDISNLASIECFLNDNVYWSDWTPITYEDIKTTYKILKENNVNPIINSLLENVTIEQKEASIVFKTEKKDINTLNIFFQPILPKKVISNLDTDEINWDFSPIDWIYSGKYVIARVSQDDTIWITKIYLEKNPKYNNNPAYIDKIIFKNFKNPAQFLKHKTSVSIFNDKNNLIWDSIPKFNQHKYSLNQYLWLFVNTEKIPYPKLRNFILKTVNTDELIWKLNKQNFKKIDSPFFNNLKLDTKDQTTPLNEMLSSLGYYSKTEILNKLWATTNKNYSDEADIKEKTNTWSTELKIEKITKNNYLVHSKIITKPDRVDNYNYITKNDLSIEWKVDKLIDAIYLNDKKIDTYKPWTNSFIINLKNYLKIGKNNFKIYFEKNWKKELIETITFFYNPDKSTHEKYENELLAQLNKKAKENALIEKIKNSKNNNSPINKELVEKLNKLNPKFYYNKNLESYSLSLYYIENNLYNKTTAEYIKEKLENLGIEINLQAINIKTLTSSLKQWEKNYDLLIAGINLGYFDFNIFPYFHSSQAKYWYNFSKIKKLSLDQILEELKSHNLWEEKLKLLEWKINEILKEEAVFKPLFTPLYSNLVDKNIKAYKLPEKLPSEIYRFSPLINSYILKKKIINYDDKSIKNYFKYLLNILF